MNFPERAVLKHSMRSFVTEAEVEERKKQRQEEWDKTRKPEDPLEPPDEEYDPRPLFDRLLENKNKKEEEYEEAHKLKNMIRGLDNDEVAFLEFVDQTKLQEENLRFKEEADALREFKEAAANSTAEDHDKKLQEFKKSLFSSSAGGSAGDGIKRSNSNQSKKSQAALLMNVVKRKSEPAVDKPEAETSSKKAKTEPDVSQTPAQCIAVLPGLVSYFGSDSSDSENSSDSSVEKDELLGFDLLPKLRQTCEKE